MQDQLRDKRCGSTQLNALALNNKIHEHDALTSRVGLGWVGSLLNAIYLTIYKVTELIQSPSNEWSLSSFICFCHPRSRSLFNFKLQTLGRGILIKVFWQKEKERAGERLTSWVYLLIKDGCQVSPNPPRLLILTQLAFIEIYFWIARDWRSFSRPLRLASSWSEDLDWVGDGVGVWVHILFIRNK